MDRSIVVPAICSCSGPRGATHSAWVGIPFVPDPFEGSPAWTGPQQRRAPPACRALSLARPDRDLHEHALILPAQSAWCNGPRSDGSPVALAPPGEDLPRRRSLPLRVVQEHVSFHHHVRPVPEMLLEVAAQLHDGVGLQGVLGQESTVRIGVLQRSENDARRWGLDRLDRRGVLIDDAVVRHASKAPAAARRGAENTTGERVSSSRGERTSVRRRGARATAGRGRSRTSLPHFSRTARTLTCSVCGLSALQGEVSVAGPSRADRTIGLPKIPIVSAWAFEVPGGSRCAPVVTSPGPYVGAHHDSFGLGCPVDTLRVMVATIRPTFRCG